MTEIRETMKNTGLRQIDFFYNYCGSAPHPRHSSTPSSLETLGRIIKFNPIREPRLTTLEGMPGFSPWDPTKQEVNGKVNFEILWDSLKILKDFPVCTVFHKRASILASGGMTVDICTFKCVEAKTAYLRMIQTFEMNEIGLRETDVFEICNATIKLLNKEEVRIPSRACDALIDDFGYKYKVITNQELYRRIVTAKATVKVGERCKAKPRAIVMVSSFFKSFQTGTEEINAKIGEFLRASSITVGGEEKKRTMETIFETAKMAEEVGKGVIVCIGDCTKWNECMSIISMALITSFSMEGKYPESIIQMCLYSYGLWIDKRLDLGKGMSYREGQWGPIKNELMKDFLKVLEENPDSLPEWMRERCAFLEEYKDLFNSEDNTFTLPTSMFMGMFNFSSSNVAALAASYANKVFKEEGLQIAITLSSDDYLTFFMSDKVSPIELETMEGLATYGKIIERAENLMKEFGINPSEKKNLYTRLPYFEFTSQIHGPEGFIPLGGTHVGSLKLASVNPHADIESGRAKCVQLINEGIPGCAAVMAMQAFYTQARIAYRSDGHLETPRTEVGVAARSLDFREDLPGVLGGKNPYLQSNLMCEEHVLKDREDKWPEWFRSNYYLGDPRFIGKTIRETVSTDKGGKVETELDCAFKIYSSFTRAGAASNERAPDVLKMKKAVSTLSKAVSLAQPLSTMLHRQDSRTVHQALTDRIKELQTIVRGFNGKRKTVNEGETEEGPKKAKGEPPIGGIDMI